MFTTTQSWRTSDVDVRPTLGMTPGLPWTLKIDGQCDHNYHSRAHLTGNCEDACLGEIVFADDTCLIGDATEIQSAEQILEQIMDWKEKVHPGKTEGLRLQQPPRAPHDVRHEGEQEKVRHVGGILHEQGGPDADTRAKRTKAYIKIGQTAKAWFFGKNQPGRPLPNSLRVKIMKAVIMPTLTCFGKTRACKWNKLLFGLHKGV